MPECERCGDFTDNSPAGEYHYCDSCEQRFEKVRTSGVVVEKKHSDDDYTIYVAQNDEDYRGGTEASQVDALARGKHLADELGTDALLRYGPNESQWLVEEYLEHHPNIRSDVYERLNRVPEGRDSCLIQKLKSLL